jgi:hypothetical protein
MQTIVPHRYLKLSALPPLPIYKKEAHRAIKRHELGARTCCSSRLDASQ